MPATYIKIASTTVTSGGSSTISFTSIPNTYTDLTIAFSAKAGTSVAFSNNRMQFNSDTSTNYDEYLLASYNNNPVVSEKNTGSTAIVYSYFMGTVTSTFASGTIYIPNYTSSLYKVALLDSMAPNFNANTNWIGSLAGGWWKSTSAITQIDFSPPGTSTYSQYTTFTLYGIKKA